MAKTRTHQERAETAHRALLDVRLGAPPDEERDAIAREMFPGELVQAARKVLETRGRPKREEYINPEAFEEARGAHEEFVSVLDLYPKPEETP